MVRAVLFCASSLISVNISQLDDGALNGLLGLLDSNHQQSSQFMVLLKYRHIYMKKEMCN
uniref:Uncharacterized protein n=1 Tax=Schistosoma japonicum TaxID=6182 RepID=Q5BVW9_SCHJA|nr:unknown [Schistosoma japonicum]